MVLEDMLLVDLQFFGASILNGFGCGELVVKIESGKARCGIIEVIGFTKSWILGERESWKEEKNVYICNFTQSLEAFFC